MFVIDWWNWNGHWRFVLYFAIRMQMIVWLMQTFWQHLFYTAAREQTKISDHRILFEKKNKNV